MDAVNALIALTATILDGRVAQNIHRVTATACRLMNLLRFIPPGNATKQWSDFANIRARGKSALAITGS